MTPSERARRFIDTLEVGGWMTSEAFADVIRAAVAEERQACAMIADEWNDPLKVGLATAAHIAEAIRARGVS